MPETPAAEVPFDIAELAAGAMAVRSMPRLNRRKERGVPVYSPKHTLTSVTFSGDIYDFPPHSVVYVKGVYEPARNEADDQILVGRPAILKVAAEDVAAQICAKDKWGADGFVVLDGTPEENEKRKAAADAHWRERYLELAENEIESWEQFVAGCRSENLPMPHRPKRMNAFYAFRRENRRLVQSRLRFTCPTCAEETSTEEEMQQHMNEEHPDNPTPLVIQPRPAAPAPAEDAAAPATAAAANPVRDRLRARGKELAEAALAAGLELSVADRKGLAAGDPDVIPDVENRMKRAEREARPRPTPPPKRAAKTAPVTETEAGAGPEPELDAGEDTGIDEPEPDPTPPAQA